MKSILSLWAVLSIISLCMSMDRHRNKICYNAMTCIHTAKEKCGVDGGGNYRRFYDSCDMLEFNCLKGKDYVKTSKENCQNLPPIDDDPQNETSVVNSGNGDAGYSNGNNGIEGTMTVNENGDMEGEIIIDEDIISQQLPESNKNGDEGTMTVHENDDMEGEVILDEDKISQQLPNDDKITVDNIESNQENKGIEGELVMNDNGSIEGKLVINDDIIEKIGQQPEPNMGDPTLEGQQILDDDAGEIRVDDEGGVEGEVKINEGALENMSENNEEEVDSKNAFNESGTGIDGNVGLNGEENIEAEVELKNEQEAFLADQVPLNQAEEDV